MTRGESKVKRIFESHTLKWKPNLIFQPIQMRIRNSHHIVSIGISFIFVDCSPHSVCQSVRCSVCCVNGISKWILREAKLIIEGIALEAWSFLDKIHTLNEHE